MNISKKELQAQYKEREVIGGVYAIKNTENGKILIDSAVNLQGIKNRFEFSQKTGSCVDMKLQKDWAEYGSAAFSFEVLEELKKGETQNDKEFKADVNMLKEMWLEKMTGENLY